MWTACPKSKPEFNSFFSSNTCLGWNASTVQVSTPHSVILKNYMPVPSYHYGEREALIRPQQIPMRNTKAFPGHFIQWTHNFKDYMLTNCIWPNQAKERLYNKIWLHDKILYEQGRLNTVHNFPIPALLGSR